MNEGDEQTTEDNSRDDGDSGSGSSTSSSAHRYDNCKCCDRDRYFRCEQSSSVLSIFGWFVANRVSLDVLL